MKCRPTGSWPGWQSQRDTQYLRQEYASPVECQGWKRVAAASLECQQADFRVQSVARSIGGDTSGMRDAANATSQESMCD